MSQSSRFGSPSYGLTRAVDLAFPVAVARIKETLAVEGFGVLTEIDLAATLKKKLDHDLAPYVILGACHPPSALAAVLADPAVGLLLPCNVVVTVDADGRTVVAAIDPAAMFGLSNTPGMEAVVSDVRDRLTRALAAVG